MVGTQDRPGIYDVQLDLSLFFFFFFFKRENVPLREMYVIIYRTCVYETDAPISVWRQL